ncbi:MAG: hypothetical protein Q8K79_08630 [Solirubrobacteraceae bacterium]|nr:hypothetical protein [Solirubrobacteraceae bacterium]
MSLMNKLTQLAKSQQGKDLVEKAKTFANDPKTREKIDEARTKFSGHVDTAKQKMAEKKADDAGNGAPTYGEETSAANTPKYGEESPASSATTADTPPTAPDADPVDKPNPTYGEEEGDKPLYGEDGPKAA